MSEENTTKIPEANEVWIVRINGNLLAQRVVHLGEKTVTLTRPSDGVSGNEPVYSLSDVEFVELVDPAAR